MIHVSGRVQGVFFRHSARIKANELGITGWARNKTDGSVIITAEGGREALERFAAWCRAGPLLAKVEHIDVQWQDATAEFKKFEIL